MNRNLRFDLVLNFNGKIVIIIYKENKMVKEIVNEINTDVIVIILLVNMNLNCVKIIHFGY